MSWDERWAASGPPGPPTEWLVSAVDEWGPPLPATALDIAGGNGRHALWLAQRGYSTTIIDVSPVGLSLARAAAVDAGTSVDTIARDIEAAGLTDDQWNLAVMIRYFDRSVLRAAAEALAPNGVLLFAQPTAKNLERHPHPRRNFLPDEGEIATLLEEWAVPDLTVRSLDEKWRENDCHEVRLVAQRSSI